MIALLWVAFVVLACLDLWAKARGARRLECIVKPGAMVALLALTVACGALDSALGIALLGALACCLLGDVLLLGESDPRFLGGLTAFLAGHLGYAACILIVGLTHPWWGLVAALALLSILPIAARIVRGAVAHGGRAMGAAVTAYVIVICAMAVLGWATGQVVLGLGAALFVVSDTILGFDRFVRGARWAGVGVMATYLAAQALLTLGVVALLP